MAVRRGFTVICILKQKKSPNSSIDLCVLRDAYHELFCVLGDFHAWGTQGTEVAKSLNLSALRFLGSCGWPSVTYDWIVVALNTVDQSKLTLLPSNYPRNHCAESLWGEKNDYKTLHRSHKFDTQNSPTVVTRIDTPKSGCYLHSKYIMGVKDKKENIRWYVGLERASFDV